MHALFLSQFLSFCCSFCNEEIQVLTSNLNIHYEDLERTKAKVVYELLQANELNQIVPEATYTACGIINLLVINNPGLKYINNMQVSKSKLENQFNITGAALNRIKSHLKNQISVVINLSMVYIVNK